MPRPPPRAWGWCLGSGAPGPPCTWPCWWEGACGKTRWGRAPLSTQAATHSAFLPGVASTRVLSDLNLTATSSAGQTAARPLWGGLMAVRAVRPSGLQAPHPQSPGSGVTCAGYAGKEHAPTANPSRVREPDPARWWRLRRRPLNHLCSRRDASPVCGFRLNLTARAPSRLALPCPPHLEMPARPAHPTALRGARTGPQPTVWVVWARGTRSAFGRRIRSSLDSREGAGAWLPVTQFPQPWGKGRGSGTCGQGGGRRGQGPAPRPARPAWTPQALGSPWAVLWSIL